MPSITPIEAKTIHAAMSGATATNADWMFTSIQARRAARNAMSAFFLYQSDTISTRFQQKKVHAESFHADHRASQTLLSIE